MAQTKRFTGRARRIVQECDGSIGYYYHDTAVATVYPNGSVILNSGGWRTVTTRTAINQAGNQSGLGFRVYQKNYAWFVTYRGATVPFRDYINLK